MVRLAYSVRMARCGAFTNAVGVAPFTAMRVSKRLRTGAIARLRAALLSVNAAHSSDVSDPVDRQHVSCDAVVDAVIFGVLDHVVEAGDHNVFQPLVDHLLFPDLALAFLDPLDLAPGHSSGVRLYVWDDEDDEDAFAFDYVVGRRRSRAVSAFGQNLAFDSMSVMTRDLIFGRGGQ